MTRKKKIVVLGVEAEYEAVYREQLNRHSIYFEGSANEFLTRAINADVIVICVDRYKDVIDKVFTNGYSGGIVAVAHSRKSMGTWIQLPHGKKITPVSCRGAPEAIIQALTE